MKVRNIKVLFITFLFVSMAAWAAKSIAHTTAYSGTAGGHIQAAIKAVSYLGASGKVFFVSVTDTYNTTKFVKVESNGSFLEGNYVSPDSFADSFLHKEFQRFPELYEQMYNYATNIWGGRGFSVSGDVITATNRYSMTRYKKNTKTGRTYVEEIEPEVP